MAGNVFRGNNGTVAPKQKPVRTEDEVSISAEILGANPIPEQITESPQIPPIEVKTLPRTQEQADYQDNPALSGIMPDRKTGKAYTIYLDSDVVSEVDRIAKKTRSNRSKVISIILRNVLLKK